MGTVLEKLERIEAILTADCVTEEEQKVLEQFRKTKEERKEDGPQERQE